MPCFVYDVLQLLYSNNIEANKLALRKPQQHEAPQKHSSKAPTEQTNQCTRPRRRQRKESQPNWSGPKVMALIHTNQKKHEAQQLIANDHMETAIVKWTKITNNVANVGFSVHFRRPMRCKDKPHVLFSYYKKISDYKNDTRHNQDYFCMPNKKRNEVNLPTNFCQSHFKEMEYFLH